MQILRSAYWDNAVHSLYVGLISRAFLLTTLRWMDAGLYGFRIQLTVVLPDFEFLLFFQSSIPMTRD